MYWRSVLLAPIFVKILVITEMMNERLAQLDEIFKKFAAGELNEEGLEKAIRLSREMYEQWVIVKHEFHQEETEDSVKESFKEIKSAPKNSFKTKEKDLSIVEEEAESIDEDLLTSENQTTLIEIIEEIQEDQSINERISQGNTKESLAQKHAKKAIANIDKSIGLNQRFSFIKNLFDNNKEEYYAAVEKLNSCASFLEADDYIHNELMVKFSWDENTVHVIKFIDLIERRYLPH